MDNLRFKIFLGCLLSFVSAWVIVIAILPFRTEASYLPTRGPAGMVFAFAGTVCPTHATAANGASLLRAGTYSNLFAAISTNYGTADGTHFNLPDLRGKFPRGVDGTASNDPDHASRTACLTGGNTGNNVGSCEADQFKSHSHAVPLHPGGSLGGSNIPVTDNTGVSSGTEDTGSSGGNETRPINVYVLYCLWY